MTHSHLYFPSQGSGLRVTRPDVCTWASYDGNLHVPTECSEFDRCCNVDGLNFPESSKPTDRSKGKRRIVSGDAVHPSQSPAPLSKNDSSLEKLISMQRCLWGSFGLASYLTVNAIYWIMSLLGSQDCVKKRRLKRSGNELGTRESTGRCAALCCVVGIQVRDVRGGGGCLAESADAPFNMKSK